MEIGSQVGRLSSVVSILFVTSLCCLLNYCTFGTEPCLSSQIRRRPCQHIRPKTTSGPVDLTAICRNKTKNPSSIGRRTLALVQKLGEFFFYHC